MSEKKSKSSVAIGLLGLTFGLFCLWLMFSGTAPFRNLQAAIDCALPDWLVIANLILGPCFLALAAGNLRISLLLRFSLASFMLLSILILEISFRRYLIGSCISLTSLLLGAYWIIPKWTAKRRNQRQEAK